MTKTFETSQVLDRVRSLGVSIDDAMALRRISMALHRWHELECNGAIKRAGDVGDGAPFWHSTYDGRRICRALDRERGALRRLSVILSRYPDLTPYVQSDPRGCALYLIRPGDVPDGKEVESYYSRGVAVY
jgi:hypothetical protein